MINISFRVWSALLLVVLIGSSLLVSTAQDLQVVEPPQDYSYLTNPGIGWQPGVDFMLPSTVTYYRRAISWVALNPEEGQYNWEPIDQLIAASVADGQQISFRVYTMRGEDFGGHQVPEWVLDKGATILDIGDPDYNNCTYQEEWGSFVQVLRERYDGNPDIAYIDISGYSNFNEWSWLDDVTEWDDLWEQNYAEGTAGPETIGTLDGQARRHLADMFIGGEFDGHECVNADGEIETVNYEYPGFSSTQLVMPFAGVRQATQYVATQRADVGFRHDCLGYENTLDLVQRMFRDEIPDLWKRAPVVYEFCFYGLDDEYLDRANTLLLATHASMVHDNIEEEEYRDRDVLSEIMRNVGYRYVLREASFPYEASAGELIPMNMDWVNVGYAPSYPSMGQRFALMVELTSDTSSDTARFEFDADISEWMPSEDILDEEPETYHIQEELLLPEDLPAGEYRVNVAIMDLRTEKPIVLAIYGRGAEGWYTLGTIEVIE